MKTFYSIICSLLVMAFAACTNTDDLKSDINSLKDRVSALETQVAELNTNIKGISALSKGGVTVSSLSHDPTNGTYTVNLSGGVTLKLMEATSTTGKVPQIGIDADGYWQVSYDGGATFTQIKVGGNAVKAKGEDGLTPSFRISEEGYWEVSTDGTTYTQVLDVNGNPVMAKSDGTVSSDKFFKSVSATDSELSIELQDGTKLTVPIVKDFFCYFDEQYTGVQKVVAGKSAEFDLHIKGAQSVVATAPDGWTVTVGEAESDVAKVTVTAPAATESTDSRATADNTQDVSVIAMNGGYAQIAKIQVTAEAGTTPDPEPEPEPEPVALMIPEITASTTIADYLNKEPQGVTQTADLWFVRRATGTEVPEIVDETIDGTAVKAVKVVSNDNNGWYKMALGFFKKDSGCSTTKKYKVSMNIKAPSGAKIQYIIRNKGGNSSFALCTNTGESQSPKVVTTYTSAADEWVSHSTVFDFSTKRTGSPANTEVANVISDATDDDVSSFEFRIYSNTKNVTFYVANIKMEEFVAE